MNKRSGGTVGRPANENKVVRFAQIAERIQTLMSKRGISRRDMVRHLGCSEATFGNYYNGFREPPGRYAEKIAELLGITVGYLLLGKKEEAPTIMEIPAKEKLSSEDLYILKRILEKLTT